MIRVSEFVLPGHPDKFCDAVADAIIAEVLKVDADGYGQVEVAVWSDQVFLTGSVCTRRPIPVDFADVVVATGIAIGYTDGNHIDARKYRVTDTVCRNLGDPTRWTGHVNDQAICIGWAGYDAKVDWLPIEHWVAREFKDALYASCRGGLLKGQGPDGKLIARVREEGDRWQLEHVLVTLQQRPETSFLDLCAGIAATLHDAYRRIQRIDPRWCAEWADVELMLNPNGPLLNGGSDGDNGQTGRKLVMDYYGPRVPIGGGALAGKDPTHVDRVGAQVARRMALEAVNQNGSECLVRITYAPGCPRPIDICCSALPDGGRHRLPVRNSKRSGTDRQ
jgi:S-adenosylmethionine synthetase